MTQKIIYMYFTVYDYNQSLSSVTLSAIITSKTTFNFNRCKWRHQLNLSKYYQHISDMCVHKHVYKHYFKFALALWHWVMHIHRILADKYVCSNGEVEPTMYMYMFCISNNTNIIYYCISHTVGVWLRINTKEVCCISNAECELVYWRRHSVDKIAAILADNIFSCIFSIFLNESDRILIQISLKYVPRSHLDNKPTLVQVMAWRRTGAAVHWRTYASLGGDELTHCRAI